MRKAIIPAFLLIAGIASGIAVAPFVIERVQMVMARNACEAFKTARQEAAAAYPVKFQPPQLELSPEVVAGIGKTYEQFPGPSAAQLAEQRAALADHLELENAALRARGWECLATPAEEIAVLRRP